MFSMPAKIRPVLFALAAGLSTPCAWADFNDAVIAYIQGDYQRAFQLFYPLAESTEDPYAMYYLGMMYLQGQGIDRDTKVAAKWLRLAAEKGSPQAQYQIGMLYSTGNGLPRDHEQAYAWFQVSARQQHDPSSKALQQTKQKLSAEELAQAESLAREYIIKYIPSPDTQTSRKP